jgi:predicted ATPase/signal transduction histidine kinase
MNSDCERLALLGQTDTFALRRARSAASDATRLIKSPRRVPPRADDVAALRRECTLAASLGTMAALRPRWVESGGVPSWQCDDPGGALLTSPRDGAARPIAAAIAIGRQLAAALAELHARGAVHGALRPDAVLFEPASLRAWLVDFGDAAAAAAARVPFAALPADRLAYLAPEQTGHIDRPVDARTDLYALGMVLWEQLTGTSVLRSTDPLAWIHWHLAGSAAAPSEVDARIPPALSAVVLKLLAKSPEERYQSAAAVVDDLQRCERDWTQHGRIDPFEPGRRDAGGRLALTARLYGREREVQALRDAFAAACSGSARASMLLVEGYSGIGKTALIEQLYRPIVRRRGLYISGKFDQVVRSVPFGALIQAFRGLVRQLLTESEARLARWRSELGDALGSHAGVLAEVIPEIAFILGEQAAPPPLPALEAQNRFQRMLQNFVGALARPEHPLVIFLDDLQWADAATLGLLAPLLAAGESRSLLMIGACRDNEPDAAPQLARALTALQSAGVGVRRIVLGPLERNDVVRLVADALQCEVAAAEALAALVHAKTGGNPFFVSRFLVALERDGLLRFDPMAGRWLYRIEQIADAPLADNVVELMTRSIGRLPPKTQYALTLAACIGNRFDAATLATVSEQSQAATAADLADALGEGLVVGVAADDAGTPTFAFLHDRVQQAAYALIPTERRQMLHLTIGRLLRGHAAPAEIESRRLFDIVHHLNLGRPSTREPAERRDVAALDLEAGRRARSSTAHDAALALFEASHALLAADRADTDPIGFEVGLELAESRYLCGHFEAAEALMETLAARAATRIDRARVVRQRIVQIENSARYAEALAHAREGLALFDVTFPADAAGKDAALEREIAAIDALRAGRPIAALQELPRMADAETRIVMTMLTDVWSAAYIVGDPNLARLISATLVRLSLEHGNVEESAYGYVTHAITVGPMRGDYAAAYEWGTLALAVNERLGDARRRAKIHQQFHAHVALWCRPFATCIAHAREACRSGLESGDFLYAAYGAATEAWPAMAATADLERFVRDHAPSVALVEKLKNAPFADSVRALLGWAAALQGRTAHPLSMASVGFDEDAYVRRHADNPFFTTIHAVARLQLCCLLGTPAEALAAARRSARTAHLLQGTIWPVLHDFWQGIAVAANALAAAGPERSAALDDLRRAEATFATLAGHCALNYRAQALLLGAEIARLEGRDAAAFEQLGEAIEFAAANAQPLYAALAHELAARLHGSRLQPRLAQLHLDAAVAAYRSWGATAKVDRLLRASRGPAEEPTGASPAGASAAPLDVGAPDAAAGVDGLDLHSAMKAVQAIAAEVEFERLVPRLMQIALESAGAEHGGLVIETEHGPLSWTAGIGASDAPREAGIALERSTDLPLSLVHYVRRTRESVVLGGAEIDDRHGDDPYVARRRPRSLAALPVQRSGRLVGVLALANSQVAGAFSEARIAILRILASQAAIANENARLVAGLRDEVDERRRAQDGLAQALAEVERLRAEVEAENSYLRRDLIANVSHDLRTPLVSMRGYLEVLAAKGDAVGAAQRRDDQAIAIRQSEHLARLIDELFELAKLDFKGITIERESFSLADLANDVLHKFRLGAEGHDVALRVDVVAPLPPVDADLGLIERVLENLIGNALQHTPAGGSVRLRIEPAAEGVRVAVADTGAGIAAADLPFVFDRYYRSAEARRLGAGGAGLGLAITKRILELHGAGIDVESERGRGTCFSFCLPAG